jgi:hypothetical protein
MPGGLSMRTTILALGATLLVAGCGARSPAQEPDSMSGERVATVGSTAVTSADVDELLRETAVSFRALGRPFPEVGTPYYLDLLDQAVRHLVERSAREQEAVRLGAEVDRSELERKLEEVDRRAFREEARRSGLTMERIRTDIHGRLLELALFHAVITQKRAGETNTEAMKRWEQHVDEQISAAVYAPGWMPAKRLRSPIPPELQDLPKAKGRCDLKNGTFTIREVAAHGCLEDWGLGIPGVDGTPCPEVPIDDFAVEGLSDEGPAYLGYVETLMDTAPSCVPYPSTAYTVQTGMGPCFPSGPEDPCTDGRLVIRTLITSN